MEASDFEQKAIQLVQVSPEGKYEMHPTAENFLRKIPKPLAVVSVAGLYRTGKSYLLNRILLNRNDGFGVGPTINPCTKGLWCWGVPIRGTTRQGEKISILIVDSQGIGALDEDQNHDIKIFTLAILCSSTFIYNSVGSIDETALQNLSLVVNLSKNIQLNTQSNEEEDPEELASYFPSFFWVVRDFSLQLVSAQGDSLTSRDYLERALAPQKGFSDDIQEKNRIRRLLTAFFKERDCATLVRPLVNEQKLQHLYECSFQDLRPQFVEQALNLRKKVMSSARPKTLRGQNLDGTMYLSMLQSYLTAINEGGVPNIQNAWTYMCIEKCMRLQQICYDHFVNQTQKSLSGSFPCSTSQFEAEIEAIEEECYKIFESEQIGQQSREYLNQLKSKLKEKAAILRIQNERQSITALKNYIIKNFSVIEKKMKLNQFQNFQDYLRSINSFYNYLIESGPDLPKREIVYLDFLKKVITQGAEIFIKQLSHNLQSLKNLSNEKERFLKKQNEDLKTRVKIEAEKAKESIEVILKQKHGLQVAYKQLKQKNEALKLSSKSQLSKMQHSYENKLKVIQIKLGQVTLNLEDMKQKKQGLDTAYILQKKEREKEKALLQLKLNQMKDELKSLKTKEKSQEALINELTLESTTRLKENTLQSQRKITDLTQELEKIRQVHNQTVEAKFDLQNKLRTIEANAALASKKFQEELTAQAERFESLRQSAEGQKCQIVGQLRKQVQTLRNNLNAMTELRDGFEVQVRELRQRMQATGRESQKQIAILRQQIEFLNSQAMENKEKFARSLQHYEVKLASQNELKEEELKNRLKAEAIQIEEQLQAKISELQSQVATLREKNQQQLTTIKKMQQNQRFTNDLQSRRHQNEMRSQISAFENLEEQKRRLQANYDQQVRDAEQKLQSRQRQLLDRINVLESELEFAAQRASEEQSELTSQSQESLKQLKNYYQLQKENLEQRLAKEKEKFEKKYSKLREESEAQLEEQRRNAEQEFENLKDEFNNEVSMLKELIVNLQHENDSRCRSLQTSEARCEELKQRLDKREAELSSKLESNLKAAAVQRDALQQRIMQSAQQKGRLQKELFVAGHQKQQLAKELKDLGAKYELKGQEVFYLNKSIERCNSENRQKLNDLSNQYMNQRLNYEKRLALAQQEKEFYAKKIQDFEKEQIKNLVALEELGRKLTAEHHEEIRALEQKRSNQYLLLETKYEKMKKCSKQYQQTAARTITDLQKQLALEQQKNFNLSEKCQDLEEKRSADGSYLSTELANVRLQLAKVGKEAGQEVSKLKRELTQVMNERNQMQILYEKDKILLENKNIYLEESKDKNKREYSEKIRSLEQTLQNIQRARLNDKNYMQNIHTQNISKLEKKHQNNMQEATDSWNKREKTLQASLKDLQLQMRALTEKSRNETQTLAENLKNQQRKVRQAQEGERRALSQLQKYRALKESTNSQNRSVLQQQREGFKMRLKQKEQRCKMIQKAKQQNYSNFEKERAKWNLQRQEYQKRYDELKQTIQKHEKDLEKLGRENQKLKAQKKSGKLSGSSAMSGFSRYSFERANSKYSLEDSINSISMSTSKENCNPLGQLSFFNNQ